MHVNVARNLLSLTMAGDMQLRQLQYRSRCHFASNTTVNPIANKCPTCGEESQTVEHWLRRRPNTVALRQQLFGEQSQSLSVLTTNPGSVLALARKTLL